MKIAFSALLLLTTAMTIDAGTCNQRVAVQQPTQVVAAPLLLPSYYPVQGQPQTQPLQDDVMRRLLDVLERIEAKLDAKPPAEAMSMEMVVTNACVACHSEGKNPKGSFVLVTKDGKINPDLSLGDKRAIWSRVSTTDKTQKMPPDRNMTPAGLQAIKTFVGK